MNEPKWKVERQPAWLVKAIRKTIAALSGGYTEASEILDVSENALHNRLRAGGDQVFPLGWAMVLEKAAGTTHIADSVARRSGGAFIPLVDVDDVDNGDINQRLMESIEWIGRYSAYAREAVSDGVIDAAERERIEENIYQVMVKLREHQSLLYRVYCEPEKVDASECAAPGVVANKSMCMEKFA